MIEYKNPYHTGMGNTEFESHKMRKLIVNKDNKEENEI